MPNIGSHDRYGRPWERSMFTNTELTGTSFGLFVHSFWVGGAGITDGN